MCSLKIVVIISLIILLTCIIVNYNEPLLRLPENTTNFLAAALPTNGSKFGPGTIAQVDLQTNRGFLDPASLSIRYKVSVASASNKQAKLVGTPAYTFIYKFVCYEIAGLNLVTERLKIKLLN